MLNTYKHIVVQIATPFSTGTGFILPDFGYIITNEHVVRDNKMVVVQCSNQDKTICPVIFVDQKYDVAFLRFEKNDSVPIVGFAESIQLGEEVLAIGHPLGLQLSVTKGVVSSLTYLHGDINYLQHDAALSPGNSGGPLLNTKGQLVGINSFIIKNGLNIGLSLPVQHLKMMLDEYGKHSEKLATRCISCETIVFEDSKHTTKYCTSCGDELYTISTIQDYVPSGMNRKIEELLVSMDIAPELCRRGPHSWEVQHGSARINISYHEKSGYIVLDAVLAKLTKENIFELYKYMLQQNYFNQGITFSLKNEKIVLSLLIYDQYLNVGVAKKMFLKLFKAADMYDDVLVNTFGAKWI